MLNNETLPNTSSSNCGIDSVVLANYYFYTQILCGATSLVGNILVIMVVYHNRRLRTTPNYFIVNMALSDTFVPMLMMIRIISYLGSYRMPVTTVTILCKLGHFWGFCSYETSMFSLVIITIRSFFAVVFPMRARQELAVRTRAWLIACTWLVPAVVSSPLFTMFYADDDLVCKISWSKHRFATYNTFVVAVFSVLPVLIMLVLYPVIIVRLVRQKLPGNENSSIDALRRKQNIRLTKMFVTLILFLIFTSSSFYVVNLIKLYSNPNSGCTLAIIQWVLEPFPALYHAVNPIICFLYYSSYRQEIKHILSCFCRSVAFSNCCWKFVSRRHRYRTNSKALSCKKLSVYNKKTVNTNI